MLGLMKRYFGAIGPVVAALAVVACSPGGDASDANSSAGGSATDGPGSTSSATATAASNASDSASGTTGEGTTGFETEGLSTDTGTTTGASTTGAPDTMPVCDGGECCIGPGELPDLSPVPVEVTLELTVNGVALPVSDADDGHLFLVNLDYGDRVFVGKTTFGELKTRVFPGRYALVYESESRGDLLPWNRSVVIGGEIDVAAYEPIVVKRDIEVVAARTKVLVDDAVPPNAATDDADLFLYDLATKSRTLVARTSLLDDGAFTANLVPGEYEVRYVAHAPKSVMPYNVDTAVMKLVVDGEAFEGLPEIVDTAAIAMKTTLLDGDLYFNQDPAPKSIYDHGRLYLRDTTTGSITLVTDTSFGRIDKVRILDVPETTYELVYAVVAHQSLAPVNEWATVAGAMSAAELASAVTDFTLSTVSVSGAVSIDGLAPIHDASNSGHVLLGGGAGGDRAVIGGSQGQLAAVVLASTYNAFFRHEFSDGGLPANTRGRVPADAIDVSESPVLDLQIATAMIGGDFLIGEQPPPTSAYDSGRIFLRSSDGDVVHLGLTREGAYARRIIQGTYDVFYGVESSKGAVPRNHEVRIGSLNVVGDDLEQTIAVPIAKADLLNPIHARGGDGSGRLYLRRIGTGDEIFVGTVDQPEFEVIVVPGEYHLVYRVDLVGDDVAANDGAILGCYRFGTDF